MLWHQPESFCSFPSSIFLLGEFIRPVKVIKYMKSRARMGHYTTIVSQGAPGKVVKDTALRAPGKVINNTFISLLRSTRHYSSLPDGQPYIFSPLLYQSLPGFISRLYEWSSLDPWQTKLLVGYCDESHFYLHFSSIFPYIFNTITTKRWQVANKETLLWHSWALQPSQLTQHYQDYDVNHDDRAGFLLAIQYASLYSAAFCGQPY